ncbi:nucleotidyltransferase family protein [Rubellimicrobium roseum]|uniref:Nucleotidyltransferase family protein n=1 Tax=Rubellimicrobium roseum TaxID=687525 RepID=A0A5C4NJ64_9RHOB|nr:nucleotidyltransferase family protein [Rubellimicrobium roseum]TNC74821.1 nucleotidyltransferase family protein [Rubellimicrobium roseum]
MSHLRYATVSAEAQRDALLAIVAASPTLMRGFRIARDLDLPDWWIVSGALCNQVWNHLTSRPEMTGVKDIDLFYFDLDTSWEAEDAVVARAARAFPPVPPVEPRNQARVPLWYEVRFGHPYPPLRSARDAIDRFASRTHAVGLRLRPDDGWDLHAPFGLGDLFAFRLTPNPVLPNRATHEAKAARQTAIWPELDVSPWPT